MKPLVSEIRRYLRLWRLLLRLSLSEMLMFRINGLLFGLAPIVWAATVLIFLGVIFSKVKTLGGWSLWETVFLLGVSETVFVVYWASFLINLRNFINEVRTGRFDQSLLKPINSRFLVSFRTLDFTLLGSFINSLAIFVVSLAKVSDQIHFSRLPGFLFLLAAAYAICYLFHFIFASLAFWVVNARPFLDWIFEIADFGHYPAGIYPPSLRMFFTFFIPILFFGYFPTAFLLGRLDNLYLGIAILLILALSIISRLVWRAGLQRYQSASS
ncbi:MAG: ABC-2 family transporter protein [Candidatus Nealsonbacteria bacterium]|nr:ABC-2 family transporter protein [Candidatus Nealsonbacteria bacterium]